MFPYKIVRPAKTEVNLRSLIRVSRRAIRIGINENPSHNVGFTGWYESLMITQVLL